MRDFIDKKIHDIFNDFSAEIERLGCLCECKSLTYESGKYPDYSKDIIQQYYLLRYLPAYLAEYYLMYMQVLRSKFLLDSLKILSIGCGCGVDYWGLYFAVIDRDMDPKANINYTGVDIFKWKYREKLDVEDVFFLKKNISNWNEMDEDDYNLIVFPKSIGEIPEDDFNSMCDMIANTEVSVDRIFGLCSLMDKGTEFDMQRFKKVAKIFTDIHKYKCLDDMDKYWLMTNQNQGIQRVCSGFNYPDDVRDKISSLLDMCPTFIKNDFSSCESDCTSLNRTPILTQRYINYSMLRFER